MRDIVAGEGDCAASEWSFLTLRRVAAEKIIIPRSTEFERRWCIVSDMKSAGIAAVVLIWLLAGCGGRTTSWSPNSVRLPITLRVSQGVMDQSRIHYV